MTPIIKNELSKMSKCNIEDTEFHAYQISQILRGRPWKPAKNKLMDWLPGYLKDWLHGDTDRRLSLFLIHRLIKQIDNFPQKRLLKRAVYHILLEQIAFAKSGANANFDAIELSLALSIIDSNQVSPRIIDSAVNILNSSLENGGTWALTQHTMHLANRPIACSSFEALSELLRSNIVQNPLEQFNTAIDAHLSWLYEQSYGDFPWLVSDIHSRKPQHETWFNCVVIDFLLDLKKLATKKRINYLMAKYSARDSDTNFSLSSMLNVLSKPYIDTIKKEIVTPAKSLKIGEKLRCCTVVLFGLPGTAKTTFAEVVAKETNWPYVELGVADFLRDGFDKVFGTADQIFSDLAEMQKVVILLDEVESVFESRTREDIDVRQRFLTSALLPPLLKLRSRARSILFIATNYIRSLDPAILRPGRIDFIIGVPPPNEQQRAKILINNVGLNPAIAKAVSKQLENAVPREILSIKKSLARIKGQITVEKIMDDWKSRRKTIQLNSTDVQGFNRDVKEFERLD